MARPRGRSGGRSGRGSRGGGFSDRSRGGRGGSSYGNGGGGGNQAALVAVIVGGGLVAIILIVVLLSRGGSSEPVHQTNLPNPAGDNPSRPARKPPPAPLTDAEKAQIHSTVMRLAEREQEAVREKNDGFRAQEAQDYETAQKHWHRARDILQEMIGESELLFDRLGYERVEMYAPSDYRVTGEWPKILADIIKQLK